MARMTVKDLRDARGSHQFAMLRVETLEEAEAAARAGVELLSVPPAMILDCRFREVAPDCFAFPGDNFYEIGGPDAFLRWALPLMKHGADGVYCSGSLATVRLLADHAVPVCGHVGLIPSKATWTGGFKAVGKTLDSAKLVYQQCKALEAAGAFFRGDLFDSSRRTLRGGCPRRPLGLCRPRAVLLRHHPLLVRHLASRPPSPFRHSRRRGPPRHHGLARPPRLHALVHGAARRGGRGRRPDCGRRNLHVDGRRRAGVYPRRDSAKWSAAWS